MILVTGATGNLGKAIINQLLTKVEASQIIALVRDKNKAADLQEKGINVRIGDFHDKESLQKAFVGVHKGVLVSSSDFNDRFGQHKNVVEVATDAGVKHLVYTGASIVDINTSVLKGMLIDHFQTEDLIKEVGLPYTFMHNNLYAEMIPFYIGEKVLEKGIYFPAGSGKIPFSLRAEMGEAIANVLLDDKHLNKEYNITAEVSYSFYDIAKALSELSGKQIIYTEADPDEYTEMLKKSGLSDFLVKGITGFSTAMRNNDFDVPSNDLATLLGRKSAVIKEALKEIYKF